MKTLVVYNGGACGDLVSAMLDVRGSHITDEGRVRHDPQREWLKKPHIFQTDLHKDLYLAEAFKYYDSLPSHDIKYHIDRGHEFVGIVVRKLETAKWAATRFRALHDDQVWAEMSAASGVNDVDGYAQMMLDFSNLVADNTKFVLSLEHILQGTAVDVLSNIADVDASGKEFYRQWLLHNIN